MKRATTLEFRKAVRKYCAKNGYRIYDSYTNPSTVGCRTVGFSMPVATAGMARAIEKKLNKKGLFAEVRFTGEGYGKMPSGFVRSGWNTYIRGTCSFAE